MGVVLLGVAGFLSSRTHFFRLDDVWATWPAATTSSSVLQCFIFSLPLFLLVLEFPLPHTQTKHKMKIVSNWNGRRAFDASGRVDENNNNTQLKKRSNNKFVKQKRKKKTEKKKCVSETLWKNKNLNGTVQRPPTDWRDFSFPRWEALVTLETFKREVAYKTRKNCFSFRYYSLTLSSSSSSSSEVMSRSVFCCCWTRRENI